MRSIGHALQTIHEPEFRAVYQCTLIDSNRNAALLLEVVSPWQFSGKYNIRAKRQNPEGSFVCAFSSF